MGNSRQAQIESHAKILASKAIGSTTTKVGPPMDGLVLAFKRLDTSLGQAFIPREIRSQVYARAKEIIRQNMK